MCETRYRCVWPDTDTDVCGQIQMCAARYRCVRPDTDVCDQIQMCVTRYRCVWPIQYSVDTEY